MQKIASEKEQAISYERQRCQAEIRRTREDLTRMIPADNYEEILYPSGKIDKPYLRVACTSGTFERFTPDQPIPMWLYNRAKIFDLQAEQFALVLPDGRRVCWWGWRMR